MTPAVAAPADKRFKRARVKPARQRGVTARQAWLALRVALILGVALYGGWRGTVLALGAPGLQVARITMQGNERLSQGEVLALLDGVRGRNILALDLDELQARLLASPWVAEATLRRLLPSRLDIELRERHPVGIGRLAGALYLIDGEGIVIDEYGPNYADLDLPIIDGLAARPGDAGSVVDPVRARLAAALVAALGRHPALAARVSQVDVADAHDAVVMLDGETAVLRLGDRDFAERLQHYIDVAPVLRERVADIDAVDLRFENRVYVRPAKAQPRTRTERN